VNACPEDGKYRLVAEINMIPFIDVALVLLIVFMVMTPALIRGQIKVNLPQAGKTESTAVDKSTVTVQVDKRGAIYMEGKRVDPGNMVSALRRRLTHPQTQPIRIEADKDVSFQHVVVVLNAGKEIGATKVSVSVKPELAR
jgi:biopolymer transport protein TolR